ncbi:MAG: hypothetical protein ACI9W2_000933 [Gammaproteobacteria bacterium]|jgi:hypothetical protein
MARFTLGPLCHSRHGRTFSVSARRTFAPALLGPRPFSHTNVAKQCVLSRDAARSRTLTFPIIAPLRMNSRTQMRRLGGKR